jgi:AcrR family transcriptional regulator
VRSVRTRSARRQPAARPEAIINAALEEFAEKGYAAARLDDVAAKAGISKGLVYVYFKTKEELFKAVVRAFIVPRFEALVAELEASPASAEALIRGPIRAFMKSIPKSRIRVIARLLIAEGPKHPDLTGFYHAEVVSRGKQLLSGIIARGVERGEFRPNALTEFPQLLMAPVIMAVIWTTLFDRHDPLDTDRLIDAHVELVLRALRPDAQGTGP